MSSGNRQKHEVPRDPVFIGAEAAMNRAAKRARERAEAVARVVAASEQSAENSGGLNAARLDLDASSRKINPMNRDTVLNVLRTHKATLAELYGVNELALFGSFARDQATDGSDIDVLVRFDVPPDWRRYFGAQGYLEDLLGRTVDLAIIQDLRDEIRPYVEQEAINV